MPESHQNKQTSKPDETKENRAKKRRDETVAEDGTEESAGHGIAGEPSEADKGRSRESIGRVRVRERESIGRLWRNGGVLVLGLRIGRGRHRHPLFLSVSVLDSKRRDVFEGEGIVVIFS